MIVAIFVAIEIVTPCLLDGGEVLGVCLNNGRKSLSNGVEKQTASAIAPYHVRLERVVH